MTSPQIAMNHQHQVQLPKENCHQISFTFNYIFKFSCLINQPLYPPSISSTEKINILPHFIEVLVIWCLPTLSSPWHPGTTPWNTWKRCAPSTLQVGSLWAVKGHCFWDFMMRCWWDFAHTSFQINMFETWFSYHYSHRDPDRGRWIQENCAVVTRSCWDFLVRRGSMNQISGAMMY